MPDPIAMTDEELDAAIANNPPEPEAPESEPGVQTPEPTEPEAPETPEVTPPAEVVEETPPEDDPKPPSRRETLRIQQLLNKYSTQPQEPTQRPTARTDALDYEAELDAPPEIIQRLKEDRDRAEQARYDEGLKQAQSYQWNTLLLVDAPQVESQHPQLDKNSSEFHPAVADSLNSWYLQMSGYNPQTKVAERPGMRYSEFVDGMYELAEELAATKVQTTTRNVAQQAASTAIRPDGSSSTKLDLNKAPEQMTDEELDAMIALGPKRK